MEKDILDGKIGEVGSYDLEFKGGKLSFSFTVSKQFDSGLVVDAPVRISLD
jgi:hypothetical protein